MKTESCKLSSQPPVSGRVLKQTTRTTELLKHAGLLTSPRRSCSRLFILGQTAAFLFLFAACADAALDSFADDGAHLTPAEIAQICEAEDYASDACIEWAAITP